VPTLIQNADDQEERAGRDAVIDLLQHRPGQSRRIQRENSQRAETEVADGRVSHQLLHVLLHQRNQRAVDDADERQVRSPSRAPWDATRRGTHEAKEGSEKAHESVGPHLQQNARQNDGAGGWRLHVRIRQPGVKRKHRNFDGEADEESDEEPDRNVETE
jgi:hypothetical protein